MARRLQVGASSVEPQQGDAGDRGSEPWTSGFQLVMHLDSYMGRGEPSIMAGRVESGRVARWAGLALLLTIATAWQLVSLSLIGGLSYWLTAEGVQPHLLLNICCLLGVAVYAWRLRGELNYKMGQVLGATALLFGAYALAIIGGRLFFSRALLVSTLAETLVLTQALVIFRHRFMPTRVAIVAPLAGESWASVTSAAVVSDPATDLRKFDILLVSLVDQVSSEWARALARAMLAGCKVRHVGEYLEELRGAVVLEHFEVEHVAAEGISSYRTLKRLLDLALVVFILPVAVPIIALSAVAIFATSSGSIFFLQDRVGLGGQPFKMWKLRTMRPEEPGTELRPTTPGDRRVTPIGRLLRRFRLDELPQIWNVLRGEMSLIGPRPEAVPLHTEYLERLPNYAYRYLVRPGITGWAQVSAPPSATAEEARRKLTYDLYYVKRFSLALDLQIVLRTFWIITSGSGVR